MSRVSNQQTQAAKEVRAVVEDIFSYRDLGAALKSTIVTEIIELVKEGTPESIVKLKRLRSLFESIFSGRDMGRREKLDYDEDGRRVLVRDMLDEDYLCYYFKGDSSSSDIVFVSCLKRLQ